MNKKIVLFTVFCVSIITGVNAQEQETDSVKVRTNEGSNRNMLLNASSASQPRQIAIGIPGDDSVIFEDGLPVSYYSTPVYPYMSWHGGVSHEQTGTLSPTDMAMRYGVVSFGVDSRSKLAGDKFESKLNYMLNQYGRHMVDANFSTPLGKGWGLGMGTYQNFDPASNHLLLTKYHERIQMYKTSLSKSWAEGRGCWGLIYQYAQNKSISENYGPFIFVGDGSVKQLDGFRLGIDQYLPANNTIYYKDIVTGQILHRNIDDANTARIHNVNFTLHYDLGNNTRLEVNSKYKNGHIYSAFAALSGITEVGGKAGYTYENGQPFSGRVQMRSYRVDDAFEHSWMSNAALSGRSANLRHNWRAQVDYWYNHVQSATSLFMGAHEVKADPKRLLFNGESCFSFNDYGEFYKGHEQQYAASFLDEWQVTNRLWLKGGLRLTYLHIGGHVANDEYEGNQRHPDFSLIDEGVVFSHISKNKLNRAFSLEGTYELIRGFGLMAGYLTATNNNQLYHYGPYETPADKGKTVNYLRGGIYWRNRYVDLSSQLALITLSNGQTRLSFNHILEKDANGMKAGEMETYNMEGATFYGIHTPSWITDAVITPFKGFSMHVNLTLRDHQYRDYCISPTFSDGVTETYDFSGKTEITQPNIELELEPSYSINKWRIWLSARYYGKQYINLTNSLYFSGRWETFGGVSYTLNKHVGFDLSVVNILNQKGARGSIPSANLVTDISAYKNYVMAGSYIRPFTIEFSTHLQF